MQPIRSTFADTICPDLLVGLTVSDDAAVYKINEDTAIIQTLDFFTPIVDDPYDYGSIAAANSLSDVYAMGGEVILALNICGFPSCLPLDVLKEILLGGAQKVKEANGILVGGHTIEDNEPKYGLSVTGKVHPDRILTKGGAKSGDILVLSKPLGTGIITTAGKAKQAKQEHITQAIVSMKKLNKNAASFYQEVGVHACTDITGFSIIGHSLEIAEKSDVTIHLDFRDIPFLDGAKEYAGEWLFPAGSSTNEKCYRNNITFHDISPEIQQLLFTPETSGGLIAAVAPDKIEKLMDLFEKNNEQCCVVGRVAEGKPHIVVA